MTRSRVKNDFSVGIDDGADANAITIDSNERVLIGTDSGDAFNSNSLLRVQQASAVAYIQVKTDNDQTGGLLFGDTDDDFRGGFFYENATDQLAVYAGDAERLRVTANGLTFNGDTASANALNDYEEGTWTPAITATSSAVTVYSADYTKIGNVVQIQLYCAWSNNANNNNSVFQIMGLPFTHSAGTNYSAISMGYVGASNMNDAMAIIPTNGSYIFWHQNDGSAATLKNSDIHSRALQVIILSGTYHTDS